MNPMSALPAWQMRNRYDRRVRRARLSVDALAPARRLAFTVEEALRLASLPGENESRCYYFRRLRVTGLPATGDRQAWLTSFQCALHDQARCAVHGTDARAAASNAVFFVSEQEALEVLLNRVLAREPAPEWFWAMVMPEIRAGGLETSAIGSVPNATIVPAIIEALQAQPASWVGVATALFASPRFDGVRLCQAIPSNVVSTWVATMDSVPQIPASTLVRVVPAARPALTSALRSFGCSSDRTLWLAALAILLDSPAELAAGTAVARARRVLRQLALEAGSRWRDAALPFETSEGLTSPPKVLDSAPPNPSEPLILAGPELPGKSGEIGSQFQNSAQLNASDHVLLSTVPAKATPAAEACLLLGSDRADVMPAAVTPPEVGDGECSAATPRAAPVESDLPARYTRWFCQGSPTQAAGFFFLLNALHHIGIAQALAGGLAAADADFVPRLLLNLAAHGGVPADDPITLWLNSLITGLPPAEDLLQCESICWPLNLQILRNTAHIGYVHRVWYLGVRRWCWRAARASVRDVVTRAGVFSVNRTDLDVSLLLEAAEVRIRKAGLDLDPGWLPWFGRVVRFHYVLPGELYV